MLARLLIVLVALQVLPLQAYAQAPNATCKLTDEEFSRSVGDLRDWRKIHTFFSTHLPQCPEDGFYGEGYSEVIVRTLATRWSQLPSLAEAAAKSPGFKAFVLRHIDATANKADLEVILKSTTSNCPERHALLCGEIQLAATGALAELK